MQITPCFFLTQVRVFGAILRFLYTTKKVERMHVMSYYRSRSIMMHKAIHKHFLISRINYKPKYCQSFKKIKLRELSVSLD